jgi:pimeloyl-ACP methyl ester carboxylesterase
VALIAELAAMRDRTGAPYDLAAIDVPIVAGYGTEGKPYHRWAIEELVRQARHGQLAVIEGAGHAAQGSHPAEFADFVRQVHGAQVASSG